MPSCCISAMTMWTRVKQLWSALTAKLTDEDRGFVAANLTPAEQALFYAMNLPDQRHALNVAYTALRLASEYTGVDCSLLTKCTLLHDVGKVKGDVSTWDKVLTVLAHRLAPGWAEEWGRCGRGGRLDNIRHAFHVYFHHPERSAELVRSLGEGDRIADIILRHHEPETAGEPLELTLLRQADNMN